MLKALPRRLPYLIPPVLAIGTFSGLVVPPEVPAAFQTMIPCLAFLTVFFALMAMPADGLSRKNLHPPTVALTVGVNLVVVPLLAAGISLLFLRENPGMMAGLMLLGLLPSSSMTVPWTVLTGGRVPAALVVSLAGVLLGSALVPIILPLVAGDSLAVSVPVLAQNVSVVILLPFALALSSKEILRRRNRLPTKDVRRTLSEISVLIILVIIGGAMTLKAPTLAAQPVLIIKAVVPVLALYGAIAACIIPLGRLLGDAPGARALVFSCMMRNLAVSLGLAAALGGAEAGLAILPITAAFLFQTQIGALFARHSPRLFPCASCPQEM